MNFANTNDRITLCILGGLSLLALSAAFGGHYAEQTDMARYAEGVFTTTFAAFLALIRPSGRGE